MASTLPVFHSRTGSLVTLSNSNRTAQRNHPTQEFNNGVVLSAEPLRDDQILEVRIDRKVNSWSGSIEIGVTVCEPSSLNFPFSATGFRDGTWVMSGMSILCDGHSMVEDYGCDLDQLNEGDSVGVMRTSEGVLHFYINGFDQGPAARDIPPVVYAVIDLYGKCAQVSITEPLISMSESALLATCNEIVNELAGGVASFNGNVHEFLSDMPNQIANNLAIEHDTTCSDDDTSSRDGLKFHDRCGNLVKLSNGRRSAERRRPLDEFNNGVVMTNRPVKDNEVFEIRLDRLVEKWSGSIEVGITTHNPNTLDFPATMTNMRNASANRTIMMSGCGILTNGKGTRREYGQFNLDELSEGDKIGLVRKSNGHLHYFINGLDQGVAAANSPTPVWGVVDLYGMAAKVTILEHGPEQPEGNDDSDGLAPTAAIAAAAATAVGGGGGGGALPSPGGVPSLQPGERSVVNSLRQFLDSCGGASGGSGSERGDSRALTETEDVEKLLFSHLCGAHATVINGGKTAHRPNAAEDFNNGVILTSRILRPNEIFEVRLDRLIDKWAGSIEIGVTTHQPTDLDFPSTMTNIRSGTWMMTGNGVMHNGATVIEDYGQNLDRLKVGDRVGVVRKADGSLHFFVNGLDQGLCASNVPDTVYGVIDLYGQAAQATIVDILDALSTPDTDSSVFTDPDQLKFHQLHGRNASIHHSGLTACRPNAAGEFNDAIIMSNRPLRDGELFEVIIEKVVERWSGSLEAGMTLVRPEDIEFPSTMTDIGHDTWMLSGSAVIQDGSTIRNGYPLDLDSLTAGQRIGMMHCTDCTLHFFLDGVDQGVACTDIPSGVFAVIDLYGQCAQVSMSCGTIVMPPAELVQHATASTTSGQADQQSTPSVNNVDSCHRLSKCCGKNVTLRNSSWGASRIHSYNHGIVFSSDPLKYDEIFEVEVSEVSSQWSGSLKVGLTTMAISDGSSTLNIPATADDITSKVTWVVSGSEVRKCGVVVKDNYSPSLQRLEIGDRVGICRYSDGTMHVSLNGDDLGEAASGIPKNVFAVFDLHGAVEGIVVTSSSVIESSSITSPLTEVDFNSQNRDQDSDSSAHLSSCFHGNHGKNVLLREGGLQAERLAGYNNGLVVGSRPLRRRKLFQVRVGKMDPKWSGSLMIGIVGFPVDRFPLPASAISIRKPAIVIQGESVFFSGHKAKDHFGANLDCLEENSRVGVMVDEDLGLHLYVNGVHQGLAARDVPHPCWPLVDLYGQCGQVTILPDSFEDLAATGVGEEREKADLEDTCKEISKMDSSTSRNCDYFNLCNRLKASLGLPEGYFDVHNSCFCPSCHKARGDDLHRRGDPPKDFVLPFGWCRYVIRAINKAHSLNVAEKWHSAYYGTGASDVRRILDTFDLLPSDEGLSSPSMLLPRPPPYTEKSRPESLGGKQIYLSPTIRHAGGNQFSPKHKFQDPKTKKTHEARVALQVWVKPGSYKVSPQGRQDDKAQVDPHFNNSEIDWVTKERGSTMLHALLLRVE